MKRLTIQDLIEYVTENVAPLDESEQHAIREVCAYGATYGYGNLISWLHTAWSIVHVNDGRVTPETAAKMLQLWREGKK